MKKRIRCLKKQEEPLEIPQFSMHEERRKKVKVPKWCRNLVGIAIKAESGGVRLYPGTGHHC